MWKNLNIQLTQPNSNQLPPLTEPKLSAMISRFFNKAGRSSSQQNLKITHNNT